MDAKPGGEINHVLQRLDLIGGCHNRDHGTYLCIKLSTPVIGQFHQQKPLLLPSWGFSKIRGICNIRQCLCQYYL